MPCLFGMLPTYPRGDCGGHRSYLPRAFELFDTLVVSRMPLDLRADERVRVRGLIRDTTVVELEEQWDVDLADAVADAHDGGLLIVADDVTPVDFPEPLD
ncbi:hypothetical protein BH24ACT2_BH24ACT2_08090 [soil metagenome]